MSFYKSAEQFYDEMTGSEKDVDKSIYSLLYKSNMPVSMELSYMSMLMDEIEKKIYAKSSLDSQYYDNLVKKCYDMGLERKLGQKATGEVTVKGKEGAKIPKGSQVATKDNLTYIINSDVIIPKEGSQKVSITAKEEGSFYNVKANEITSFPISFKNITSVTNEKEITNGIDEESYEQLYERYHIRVTEPITSGNTNYYKLKALEVDGVGRAIVKECTNENKEHAEGNVLIIISDSNNKKADEDLIKKVKSHIEGNRFIGAKINVISAQEVMVNIDCKIDTLKEITDVKNNIQKAILQYFKKIDINLKYISFSKVNAEILNSDDSINDLKELTLNGKTDNITIEEGAVISLGALDVSKVK